MARAHKQRLLGLTGLTLVVALVVLVPDWDETARAQFKIPHLPIPNIPHLPGGGGGGQQHPANLNDLKNLQDMAQKWGEICDLDNPARQDDLGQSVAISISHQYPVSKNRTQNQYVNLVGLTIASITTRPELNYTFGILETPQVGAYSTPGGYIFVTRGALGLMQDESELAGVLAHEVAHVVLNHGIEAVKHAKLKELTDTAVKQYGQKFSAFSQYTDAGTDFVLVKGYSQDQEREADSKAIEYLVLAGYDPRGFVRFLDRLDKQGHAPTNIGKQLMSTHPGTPQRIGATTRQIATYKTIGGVTLKDRFENAMSSK